MKLHIFYKRTLIVVALSILNYKAFCQTEFPVPLFNYTNGFTESSNSFLEIGLTKALYNSSLTDSTTGFFRFGVRVPVLEDDEDIAQLDRDINNFILYVSPEFIIRKQKYIGKYKEDNKVRYTSIEPTLEWGGKKFTYFPNRIEEDEKEEWKHNYAIEARLRHFYSKAERGAWQWGFYGRFRISQSVKGADVLNILDPATNIVNEIVVSPPSVTKTISPAVGLQVYPGTAVPISFSPIFYYYSEDKDNKGDYEKSRIRIEEWIYFYPITETVGLRIGFGAFQNYYLKGKGDNENLFGGLVGVKVDTNILKSIF